MALPYYSDYRTSYDFRPMKNLNVNQPEFHPITALENDLCELITTGNCKSRMTKQQLATQISQSRGLGGGLEMGILGALNPAYLQEEGSHLLKMSILK